MGPWVKIVCREIELTRSLNIKPVGKVQISPTNTQTLIYMVFVAEWSNAPDCDSGIRKDFVGSNPILHPGMVYLKPPKL